MIGILIAGVVASVLAVLSYQSKSIRWASVLLASLAVCPVGFFTIFLQMSLNGGAGVSEAIVGYFLIAVTLNIPLSLLLGLSLSSLFLQPRSTWILALWGFLLGIGLGPLHFLSFRARFGFGQPSLGDFVALCVLDGMIAALCLPWILRAAIRGPVDIRSHAVGGGFAAFALALSAYQIPTLAFRLHRFDQPLSSLEEAGARRALNSDDPERSEAQRVLARDGDPTMMQKVMEEVATGNVDAGYGGNLDTIAGRGKPTAPACEAMIRALSRELDGWTAGSTMGSREYNIESLLYRLAGCDNPRATPLFIQAYRNSGSYMNTKQAAAKALSQSSDPLAAESAATAIHALHPNLDLEIVKEFRGAKSQIVREALLDFDRRREAFLKQLAIRKTPLDQLATREDYSALLARAVDPHGDGRDQATALLIRARRPEAIKAFEANIQFFCFKGREFRGFSDPAFVEQLISRSTETAGEEPAQIARFLGDWSPPEARDLLGKALFRFSSREAARGLGRIGGEASAKLLIRRLRSLGPLDASYAMDLVAGLAAARQPIAIPDLKRLLTQGHEYPAMNADGHLLYLSDAAAEALRRIGTPEALSLAKSHTFKGDATALKEYFAR